MPRLLLSNISILIQRLIWYWAKMLSPLTYTQRQKKKNIDWEKGREMKAIDRDIQTRGNKEVKILWGWVWLWSSAFIIEQLSGSKVRTSLVLQTEKTKLSIHFGTWFLNPHYWTPPPIFQGLSRDLRCTILIIWE